MPVSAPDAGVDLLLGLSGVRAAPWLRDALLGIAGAAGEGSTGASLIALARTLDITAEELRRGLLGSGLASETGEPGTPVVIDGDHLASRRVWRHERGLARWLGERAAASRLADCLADPGLAGAVAAAFPIDREGRALSEGGIHWQRLAACTALANALAVITGGPGTGKTTVAARVVSLLAGHRARRGEAPPNVVLAAPTAKAAQRLAEAVRDEVGGVACWTSTLHRLIGDPQAARADLAVIDEASMADVAILHRALAVLPPRCRIVLLGDPDQLASVEPGRVLGEITDLADGRCAPELAAWHAACGGEAVPVADAGHPLARVQVRLRVNWRSGDAPPLAALIADLQAGRSDAALRRLDLDEALASPRTWARREDLPTTPRLLVERLDREHGGWADGILDATSAEVALAELDRLRWLTALRQGPWGSEGLNAAWEALLLRRRGISADPAGHYHGRPLLVTRNRRDLGLDNGSLGIVRHEDGAWVACFAGRAGPVPLHRLDAIAPAWFLTVHKAQGSQAEQVEVVGVPPDASPIAGSLASRELVYTGLTRARRRVRLWWHAPGLRLALGRRSERRSGLGLHLAR